MTVRISPYLHFRDTAREATRLYADVLGSAAVIGTFEEAGMGGDPAERDKVMHAQIELPAGGGVLMASDSPASMPTPERTTVSVTLFGDASDADALRAAFDRLSEGGTVQVPLAPSPWGDEFGIVTDRFGVEWLVDIGAEIL